MWVDHTAFKTLVVDDAAHAELAAASATPPKLDPGVTLRCPSCTVPMTSGALGHLVIDTCETHGTWFDADELGAALDWALAHGHADKYRAEIEKLRAARAARSAPPPARSPASAEPAHRKKKKERSVGEGVDVVEAIVAIFEILGAILEALG
jgi:Zn-finger nucleic acid-binding protein